MKQLVSAKNVALVIMLLFCFAFGCKDKDLIEANSIPSNELLTANDTTDLFIDPLIELNELNTTILPNQSYDELKKKFDDLNKKYESIKRKYKILSKKYASQKKKVKDYKHKYLIQKYKIALKKYKEIIKKYKEALGKDSKTKDKTIVTEQQTLPDSILTIIDALPKVYGDKPKSPYTYLTMDNFPFIPTDTVKDESKYSAVDKIKNQWSITLINDKKYLDYPLFQDKRFVLAFTYYINRTIKDYDYHKKEYIYEYSKVHYTTLYDKKLPDHNAILRAEYYLHKNEHELEINNFEYDSHYVYNDHHHYFQPRHYYSKNIFYFKKIEIKSALIKGDSQIIGIIPDLTYTLNDETKTFHHVIIILQKEPFMFKNLKQN